MSKWDDRFLKMASTVAHWSKDPKRRVGAVIADADHRVVSVGYNGFPRGLDDSPALLEDSQQKLLRTLHAEANALLFAARSVAGCAAYVTYPPCSQCAAMLIQAGITRVVAFHPGAVSSKWAASWEAAEQMMREAGVDLVLR